MTDTITFQNIDLSSWDTCIYKVNAHACHSGHAVNCYEHMNRFKYSWLKLNMTVYGNRHTSRLNPSRAETTRDTLVESSPIVLV